MATKLFINGRFLTQKITGVQRVGIEITKELDKIVRYGEIELLTPPGVINDIQLNNIKITEIGKKADNYWTQVTLPLYAIKHHGQILTMAGMCPIIRPGYFMAHDVTFLRYPESFSRKFRISYELNFKLSLRRCRKVFTVSNFSKNELLQTMKVKNEKIIVVYNAGICINENIKEEQDISKWGIEKEKYYLSVSSLNAHKNQYYIYQCAKKYPNEKFVIVGGRNIKSFNSVQCDSLKNLIYTGYVSDKELFTLYKNAKGFIFPSKYEGFGLPPLEAITMGVKRVAVSDIDVFREVYPRGVYYFDPYNISNFDKDKFDHMEITESDKEYYLKQYTFAKTAEKIWKEICKIERNSK